MRKNVTTRLERLDAARLLKQVGIWVRILKAISDSRDMITDEELEELGDALDRGGELTNYEQSLLDRLNRLPIWDQGEPLARLQQSGFILPEYYVEFFDRFGLNTGKRLIFTIFK